MRSCPTRGCRGVPLASSARAPQAGAGLPFLLVGLAWGLVAPLLWLHWAQGRGTMVGFFDAAALGTTWVAVGVALSGIALDALAARLHRG